MADPTPTLTGLSEAQKRELLARLLKEKAERRTLFPLSYGQRGLWVLYQMDATNAACNMPLPARFTSHVNIPALRNALQGLIDRHPSLRTTFEEQDGKLYQRVHPQMTMPFAVTDATAWSERQLRTALETELHRPFDLETGPPIRADLFTRGENDHVFLINAHHIVGDFWSLIVLLKELRELYPAACEGREANLPPRRGEYVDYVRWQEEMLAGPQGERLWAFWKEQLAGAPQVLELPTDHPRPPLFEHRGGVVPCRISAELTAQLTELARREQVTLYTVLLAAYQVLLARYSGQEDFLVGSPFAGRGRPGFEETVGYFINMLPLRAELSGNPTFRELIARVCDRVVRALAHEEFPFPLIVERMEGKPDLSRSPLVQASFTFEKAHLREEAGRAQFLIPGTKAKIDVGGLVTEAFYVEQKTCHHDVELVLEEAGGEVTGMFRYCRDLFDRSTIERMERHFHSLLRSIVANPGARVGQLEMMDAAEQKLVLEEFNRTDADFGDPQCLHTMFEVQARKTPTALALVDGERQITYAELDAWSGRLAAALEREGVGPGDLVPLCFERSAEMVVAVLGALKSGAAYVPLDSKNPSERLEKILRNTQARILVTMSAMAAGIPAGSTKMICLDEVDATGGAFSQNGAAHRNGHDGTSRAAQPTDLAYVVYTSGSTGLPKGVMVEHRAITNTIQWRHRDLPLGSDDRVLLLVPYFFDASIAIMFSALTSGARLVIVPPGEELNPGLLVERMVSHGVTVLPMPPRLLSVLLDHPSVKNCRSVRAVYTGGESMPLNLPWRVDQVFHAALHNLYGPTETAVEAAWWKANASHDRSRVPIGRPIANAKAYILDDSRRPLPVGVPGELYIGGAGLARGYLNDPELTASRFIDNPLTGHNTGRLYRTGDRCRWLADGTLEFLGRLDEQVKVRGYRIELGEVENAIHSFHGVREAAVVARQSHAEGAELVAYVVFDEDNEENEERLLRHLRSRLPGYMIPEAMASMPSLPRTPNGKLDRRALPEVERRRVRASRPYVAPRTLLEQFLADIWCEVLGIEKVGVEDTFFELGGNSIQAAQLISRLQDKLGQRVQLAALFNLPDIANLARYLGDTYPDTIAARFGLASLPAAPARRGDEPLDPADLVIPLQTTGEHPPLFMVHPPGGIVICYQALAYHLGSQQPLYAIRSRGLHTGEPLPSSLKEMAAEYVAAIRTVQPNGTYHLGGWSLGGVIAYEMAQQLLADNQEVGFLGMLDTTIPFGEANRAYAGDADNEGQEYGIDMSLEELAELDPDEQLPYLIEHVRNLGLMDEGAPSAIVWQILEDLKNLFHTHVRLASEYALQPYAGKITMFRPLESPVEVPTPPDRGWGQLAEAVDVQYAPGQHHTMVKEPHVEVLARRLSLCLQQAFKCESSAAGV